MGVLDNIMNSFKKVERLPDYFGVSKELEKNSPDRMAYATREWFFSPLYGQPRNLNVLQVRNFAKSVWVRMCVDTLIDRVTSIDYAVVAKDNDQKDDPKVKEQIEKCMRFYRNPNRNKESMIVLHKALLRDILEIDAGVIYKVFSKDSFEKDIEVPAKSFNNNQIKKAKKKGMKTYYEGSLKDPGADMEDAQFAEIETRMPKLKIFGKRELLDIFVRDGGTFVKNVDRHGIQRGYFQYGYVKNISAPVPFANEEITYVCENPRTDSCYGYSKVQTLFEVIETLNWSIIHNRDLLKFGAIPDAIGVLKGANPEELKRWRKAYDQEYKGQPHKIMWTDMEVDLKMLMMTSKDMEWQAMQQWLIKVAAAVFKIAPSELGFTDTVNKATGETQASKTVSSALKPLVQLLAYHHTNEIIPEILQEEPLVEFKFNNFDYEEESRMRANDKLDLDDGVRTINEIRRERGLDPVPWGDEPFSKGFGSPQSDPLEDGSQNPEYRAFLREYFDMKAKKKYVARPLPDGSVEVTENGK